MRKMSTSELIAALNAAAEFEKRNRLMKKLDPLKMSREAYVNAAIKHDDGWSGSHEIGRYADEEWELAHAKASVTDDDIERLYDRAKKGIEWGGNTAHEKAIIKNIARLKKLGN